MTARPTPHPGWGRHDPADLLRLVERLPEGTTELMCHPGYRDAELDGKATRLKEERQRELEALKQAAELAKAGHGQLAAVVGEDEVHDVVLEVARGHLGADSVVHRADQQTQGVDGRSDHAEEGEEEQDLVALVRGKTGHGLPHRDGERHRAQYRGIGLLVLHVVRTD